jgi:hypothetical protein
MIPSGILLVFDLSVSKQLAGAAMVAAKLMKKRTRLASMTTSAQVHA